MNFKFLFPFCRLFFSRYYMYQMNTHSAGEFRFGGMSVQTASFLVVQATVTCLPIAVQLVQRWHSS